MAEQSAVAPLRRTRTHDAQRGPRAAPPLGVPRTRVSSAPQPARPFRVPEVVIGVLLVAGCALGAVVWHQAASATTTVVVAARAIPRGATITADDLRGAELAGDTRAMIAAGDAQRLLGQVALVDIDPSVPFTRSLVSTTSLLGAGEALTSMALAPGQLPPDLAPNDRVRIVVTSAPDAAGVSATALLDDVATVWSVTAAPDGMSTLVAVRGPIALSTDVAAASKVQLARVDGR